MANSKDQIEESTGWLKKLLPYRKQAVRGAAPEDIIKFADSLGYSVQTSPDGEMVAIPKNVSSNEVVSFWNAFNQITSVSDADESNRELRFRSYQRMDSGDSYGVLILDTYADEALNITNTTDYSLSIKISDEEISKKVQEVLNQNEVIKNVRDDIRTMCKYGDFCYALMPRTGDSFIRLDEDTVRSGVKIEKPLRPQDITLHFMPSTDYELDGLGNKVFRLTVKDEVKNRILQTSPDIKQFYNPWEFALVSIRDRDTFPYGKSVLERSRIAYEQLAVVEQLLGITRANKLDRIAVTIPGTGGDPMSVLNRLSHLKNAVKSIIFGYNSVVTAKTGDRVSRNIDMGLTEYLWVPEGFRVDKLPTSVDFGNTEDADYFRDKLIDSTGFPKAYFLADNTDTRPGTLRQQDLKFSRSLIKVQEGYCDGLRRLIILIAFYLGADVSKLEVEVSLPKSPYISKELVEMYHDIMTLIQDYLSIMQTIDSTYTMKKGDMQKLINSIGGPSHMFFTEKEHQKPHGGKSSLFEYCKYS